MQQQWRIRIRGKQRTAIDIGLVVQAVIALGQQLRDEARRTAAAADEDRTKPAPDATKQEGRS